jgi:hypothetical protein
VVKTWFLGVCFSALKIFLFLNFIFGFEQQIPLSGMTARKARATATSEIRGRSLRRG